MRPRKTGRRYRKRRAGRKSKYLRGGSGRVKATKTLTFPDKLVVKQPWIGAYTLTNPTLSAAIQKKFRLNSLWDPDEAVGTGQISARGYQQYSGIYNRYRVLGAKVMVDFYNPNTTTPLKVILASTNDPGVDLGGFSCQLQPHMIERVLNPGIAGTGRLTKYFSLARVNGVSPIVYKADDRFQAQVGTNPLEYIGLNIYAVPLGNNAGGADFNLQCTVKIIYYVEWFDQKMSIGLSEVPVEQQEEGNENK